MAKGILKRFGRLHIVVNNAGIEINRDFPEVTDDEWQRVIAVNLYGPFVVSQIAARQMVAQGDGGEILKISSVTHYVDGGLTQQVSKC